MGAVGRTDTAGKYQYLADEYDATNEYSMEYFQANSIQDAIGWLKQSGFTILDDNRNGNSGSILYTDENEVEYELNWSKDGETSRSISGRMFIYE